jgi:hypothetical protein
MKGIGFPLAVSRLTKAQLKALQAPMTARTLNWLGYPKSLSRSVVFGSRFYGGLELASLETTQGAGKVNMFIRHLWTPGQQQLLLLIVLDRLQYNSGVGYHVMEYPSRVIPHIEGMGLRPLKLIN